MSPLTAIAARLAAEPNVAPAFKRAVRDMLGVTDDAALEQSRWQREHESAALHGALIEPVYLKYYLGGAMLTMGLYACPEDAKSECGEVAAADWTQVGSLWHSRDGRWVIEP